MLVPALSAKHKRHSCPAQLCRLSVRHRKVVRAGRQGCVIQRHECFAGDTPGLRTRCSIRTARQWALQPHRPRCGRAQHRCRDSLRSRAAQSAADLSGSDGRRSGNSRRGGGGNSGGGGSGSGGSGRSGGDDTGLSLHRPPCGFMHSKLCVASMPLIRSYNHNVGTGVVNQ